MTYILCIAGGVVLGIVIVGYLGHWAVKQAIGRGLNW